MKYSSIRLLTHTIISTAIIFSASVTAKTNNYLCQVEQVAGFNFQQQDKSWQGSTSSDVQVTYKITANQTGANLDKYPYQWVNAEDDAFLGFCTDFDLDAQMSCKGLGKLEFHKDTKRFLFVNDKGYVPYNSPRPKYYIADSESPAPTMEIGTCKQI